MQAEQKRIGGILHTGDQYVIPLFQRYYSWRKEHWERLRKDIWALMENGSKPVHFLGPLVCTYLPKLPGNNTVYQLIDGQQRITTLTILLSALRDVARSRNLHELADEVTEDYLMFKRRQGPDRYKVLPRLGDREVLTEMVEGHSLDRFTESGVFAAWKYFRRHVEHWARKDSEKQLRRLLDAVSSKLSLVAILIDGENPYEIFESLNSTGLPLKESDLIRNYVFMQIPLESQQDFSDQHWKALEDMFEASDTEPEAEMTPFYRDYLMRDGQYIKEDATFVEFKKATAKTVLQPESLVNELKHFAKLELMLRRPKTVKDSALRSALRQVDGMDITTAYPLLLNLLDRNERGTLGHDDLVGCLQDLVSFVLRRSICGETTRTYGRWFVEAIKMLKGDPRRDLQAYWLDRRWPDDAALRERTLNFEIYRREGQKTRVILETLEESYGHKERVDLSTLSIEHVMPQTITNNSAGRGWKAMLGDKWQEVYDRLLHTLGNLTLTGYNPNLSNSSYEDKQPLFAESHLELNSYFASQPIWNADAIMARSRQLAERIAILWPRPDSAVGYEASAEAKPEPEGLSNAAKSRLEYWCRLDSRLEDRGVPPDMIVPTSESMIGMPIGDSGSAELVFSFNRQRGQIYVSLILSGKVGAKIMEDLAKDRDAIHRELGYELKWDIQRHGGEVYASDEDIPIRDQDDWPVQHDWFGDRLEDFQRVFVPRSIQIERAALQDPALRQSVDQRDELSAYWKACADSITNSALVVHAKDIESGRRYCRFQQLDTGVNLGAQYDADQSAVCIYIGVSSSAARKQRNYFKDLVGNHIGDLESQLGEKLHWEEPYLWVSSSANIKDKADWPRQHQWVRATAEKFIATFKPRLGID